MIEESMSYEKREQLDVVKHLTALVTEITQSGATGAWLTAYLTPLLLQVAELEAVSDMQATKALRRSIIELLEGRKPQAKPENWSKRLQEEVSRWRTAVESASSLSFEDRAAMSDVAAIYSTTVELAEAVLKGPILRADSTFTGMVSIAVDVDLVGGKIARTREFECHLREAELISTLRQHHEDPSYVALRRVCREIFTSGSESRIREAVRDIEAFMLSSCSLPDELTMLLYQLRAEGRSLAGKGGDE